MADALVGVGAADQFAPFGLQNVDVEPPPPALRDVAHCHKLIKCLAGKYLATPFVSWFVTQLVYDVANCLNCLVDVVLSAAAPKAES